MAMLVFNRNLLKFKEWFTNYYRLEFFLYWIVVVAKDIVKPEGMVEAIGGAAVIAMVIIKVKS